MYFHNKHVWFDENPNVWVDIIENALVEPYFLPRTLTGASYKHFIENVLPEPLDDVSYALKQRMWFMHDGAASYFRLTTREFLNERFGNNATGQDTQEPGQAWPPRSPDMNPIDFFCWGHFKTSIYKVHIESEQLLRAPYS